MTTCSHLNLNRLKFRIYFLSGTTHFLGQWLLFRHWLHLQNDSRVWSRSALVNPGDKEVILFLEVVSGGEESCVEKSSIKGQRLWRWSNRPSGLYIVVTVDVITVIDGGLWCTKFTSQTKVRLQWLGQRERGTCVGDKDRQEEVGDSMSPCIS